METGKREYKEKIAVNCLRDALSLKLQADFEGIEIFANRRLGYYCPTGAKQPSFETDLSVWEDDKIPRVVMEVKYGSFTTHDVITYSEKARKHKILYPYLQYGFLIYNAEDDAVACRFLYHCDNFDFVFLHHANTEEFLYKNIIVPTIENSKNIEKLIDDTKKTKNKKVYNIKCFRKDFVLPSINEDMQSDKSKQITVNPGV